MNKDSGNQLTHDDPSVPETTPAPTVRGALCLTGSDASLPCMPNRDMGCHGVPLEHVSLWGVTSPDGGRQVAQDRLTVGQGVRRAAYVCISSAMVWKGFRRETIFCETTSAPTILLSPAQPSGWRLLRAFSLHSVCFQALDHRSAAHHLPSISHSKSSVPKDSLDEKSSRCPLSRNSSHFSCV